MRVVDRDGEPWFVATDVCRVLELTNPTEAVRGLDDDETITLSSIEGNPRQGVAHQLRAISESGLYALIFKSRKPRARVFRKWVAAVVLPAIRKEGRYEAPAGAEASPPVSLYRFVEAHCNGWELTRQMEFGAMVRRFAKSMGVLFQVATDREMGRVFCFPAALMERVLGTLVDIVLLPDPALKEFGRLLEEVLAISASGSRHSSDFLRGLAKELGLFKGMLGADLSVASERSAFGKLCARFCGHVFPGGAQMQARGSVKMRNYEVNQIPLSAEISGGDK